MPSVRRPALICSLVLLGMCLHASADAQSPGQGGGVAVAASPYRLLRTISGSKGEIRDGRYVVLDPRTTFRLPEDTTIVVYFEWLGPPGKHLMAGTWRGPANTTTSNSFEYVAKERSFSAYWELTLTANAPRGQWTLDATINGIPAGVHAFEVVGPDAPPPTTTPVRTPLTRPEAFSRTLDSSMVVEALDTAGSRIAVAPGFLVDAAVVATSFAVLDNAASIRVRTPQGRTYVTDRLVGWNRRQGWALVSLTESPGPPPARAAGPARPGEMCYSVAASPDGNLTVAPCEVVGKGESSPAHPRIDLGFAGGGGSPGAPVLNEYGEVIGLMTGVLVEQVISVQQAIRLGELGEMPVPAALPIAALPRSPWPPATSVATMAERGLFAAPVTLGRHVATGGFASKVAGRGPTTQPENQRVEFLVSDKTMAVFVTWAPSERIKGVCNLRLYDPDNTSLGEGKPHKISVRARQLTMSVWSLAVPGPGIYRADVTLDGAVAWRGHFRVKE